LGAAGRACGSGWRDEVEIAFARAARPGIRKPVGAATALPPAWAGRDSGRAECGIASVNLMARTRQERRAGRGAGASGAPMRDLPDIKAVAPRAVRFNRHDPAASAAGAARDCLTQH
jgi:hypothetical protein